MSLSPEALLQIDELFTRRIDEVLTRRLDEVLDRRLEPIQTAIVQMQTAQERMQISLDTMYVAS